MTKSVQCTDWKQSNKKIEKDVVYKNYEEPQKLQFCMWIGQRRKGRRNMAVAHKGKSFLAQKNEKLGKSIGVLFASCCCSCCVVVWSVVCLCNADRSNHGCFTKPAADIRSSTVVIEVGVFFFAPFLESSSPPWGFIFSSSLAFFQSHVVQQTQVEPIHSSRLVWGVRVWRHKANFIGPSKPTGFRFFALLSIGRCGFQFNNHTRGDGCADFFGLFRRCVVCLIDACCWLLRLDKQNKRRKKGKSKAGCALSSSLSLDTWYFHKTHFSITAVNLRVLYSWVAWTHCLWRFFVCVCLRKRSIGQFAF